MIEILSRHAARCLESLTVQQCYISSEPLQAKKQGVPVNVFLLLGAYYILKVVRDTLILAESGAEVASYSSAGQALLLLLVVPAYSAFAARTNRIQLVTWATLFFVSHLGVFFLIGNAGYEIGIPFYLWTGVFNVFVVAQFWAFANDIYTKAQGERLFPIIGVGASLGAWVGTALIGDIFEAVGPYVAMLIGAASYWGVGMGTAVVLGTSVGHAAGA